MAERVQRERTSRSVDEVTEAAPVVAGAVDYDAILDRIDAILETDAEEYVRSFVQKGGQ